ncbi:inner membrane protein YjjP [Oxobacter pfennigii]|uniref:Inner membrane protein YjjP n=1 Tax=Oxobacter pfennigii TaxID=36849 RepID=A0A0P8WAN6_9CLOT|nr:threonine/serine exporter family protein [Oxobacter pfennigii]KPU44781.1 inner membrane protein YjjP [Oxobacter pfennigii]
MEAKQVLKIALWAGEILLTNGAEAYRVEETIENICRAYGHECECLAIEKGIFVSIAYGDDEKVTSLKKIKSRNVDLHRIELVNTFSRNIQKELLSYDEAKRMLKEIEKAPNFSLGLRLFSAGMISFIYTLFFNGTIYDAIASAPISIGIYAMLQRLSKAGLFKFLEYFLSGLIIGGVSMMLQGLFPFIIKDNVITGSIIILIPGVPLTNGIKDIIYGHSMSGMIKFAESLLIIIAIGAGIAVALSVGTGVGSW